MLNKLKCDEESAFIVSVKKLKYLKKNKMPMFVVMLISSHVFFFVIVLAAVI